MPDRFSLPNGLTVVHEHVDTARVVAAQVWVKVGSADESPDEIGLAHLHEHMLFKGTARRGPGEIARAVEANGGEINAWTSYDQTAYHVVMASRHARMGLDVLADAVRNSAFDAGELEREIEVVCEEIKRSQDMPSRKASKDLFSAAFQVHPYGRPVIGFEANVRAHTRERVLAFYKRYYAPENMVLSVAGDVPTATVRQWAEELFGGPWERNFQKPGPRKAEPERTGVAVHLKEDEVKEAWLHLAFAGPRADHPDTPALDLLALLAGQGDASRLAVEVKRQSSLANSASAWAYTPNDDGLIAASLVTQPETAVKALAETARVLFALRTELVSQSELDAVKALVESETVYQKETMQGLARKLAWFEAAMGGIEKEARYYEEVARVTPDQLKHVAERWLTPERAVVTGLLPKGSGITDEAVRAAVIGAKEAKSGSGERRSTDTGSGGLRLAPLSKKAGSGLIDVTLSSGARVLVRPERSVPLFALRGSFNGGLRYETEATHGLTPVLSRTWTRGTANATADEISRRIDAMAGSLHAVAGRSSMGLRGEFLSRHFDRGFAMFTDVLLNPTFNETDFERERKFQLQDLKSRDDRPSSVAFDLLARTLWTKHPYRLAPQGSEAGLSALTPAMLKQHHGAHLQPSQLTLAVVGDVDPDRVLQSCEAAFGQRTNLAAQQPSIELEPQWSGRREAKKALQKAQSHLVLGFPGARVSDSWRRALEVLVTLLNGQSGRLFMELRDKNSLCYSVSSLSLEGPDPGYFAVYMGTSPDKVERALAGIEAELEKLKASPVGAEELARAREHLIGVHEVGLQRNGARAATISLDACYGLPADGYLRYADEISAVTPEHVLEVARKVIDFGRCALVVVGPEQAPKSDGGV
jgi:zinc protease